MCLTPCLMPTSAPSGHLTRHIVVVLIIIIIVIIIIIKPESRQQHQIQWQWLPALQWLCPLSGNKIICPPVFCLIVQRCQAQVQVPIPCDNKLPSPRQFSNGGIRTKIK